MEEGSLDPVLLKAKVTGNAANQGLRSLQPGGQAFKQGDRVGCGTLLGGRVVVIDRDTVLVESREAEMSNQRHGEAAPTIAITRRLNARRRVTRPPTVELDLDRVTAPSSSVLPTIRSDSQRSTQTSNGINEASRKPFQR